MIRCKLFGHKFIGKEITLEDGYRVTITRVAPFCLRCGYPNHYFRKNHNIADKGGKTEK